MENKRKPQTREGLMHNTFHHAIFEDSATSLELDKFKDKMRKLYAEILEKTYRQQNPGATPEEVAAYVEANQLEFPGDEDTSTDDEVDGLMDMLDAMVDSDELEPVSEMSMEDSPKEHTGEQLQSKTHEKGEKVVTKDLEDHLGGLFKSHIDTRAKVRVQKTPEPTGATLRRDTTTAHTESFKPMFEKMREDLRKLVDRQRAGVHQLRERI